MAYQPFIPQPANGGYNPFAGFDSSAISWNGDQYNAASKQFGAADPRTVGALQTANMRYNGDLTRGLMGSGFTNQMTGIENLFDQYSQYGGMFGGGSGGPVYSPQAKNGYGSSNPFKIGSF